jgi:hypothetical protein
MRTPYCRGWGRGENVPQVSGLGIRSLRLLPSVGTKEAESGGKIT